VFKRGEAFLSLSLSLSFSSPLGNIAKRNGVPKRSVSPSSLNPLSYAKMSK
jgi:hypothetical protein